MTWRFGIVAPDEKQQEATQREQFDNDQIQLGEALVRETIQNSMDAAEDNLRVEVHFQWIRMAGENADYFNCLLKPLEKHLRAAGWRHQNIGSNTPEALVIEDFNTTGLTGSTSARDEENFCKFWRWVGGSNKTGKAGGRWGLGKVVFSSSSQFGCFLGVTKRTGDENLYLMGAASLRPHSLEGKEHREYGFLAVHQEDKSVLPEHDHEIVNDFLTHIGLTRNGQSGLSIVIPYPLYFEVEKILNAIVENYYFPIANNRLVVTVDGKRIGAESLDSVANELASPKQPFSFLREIAKRWDRTADVEGIHSLTPDLPDAEYFDAESLDKMRALFEAGELIHVRFPMVVRPRDNVEEQTWFEAFLQKTPPEETLDAWLFVRDNMVLSEELNGRVGGVRGAVVVQDEGLVGFLGDAENPAHTKWSERAVRLREQWAKPATTLRAVRWSLRNLYRVLAAEERSRDDQGLAHFFSIKQKTTNHAKLREPKAYPENKPHIPNLRAQATPWRVQPRQGAFSIVSTKNTQNQIPLRLRIEVAYDVEDGNAFSLYESHDFSLSESGRVIYGIRIATVGKVKCVDAKANLLEIDIEGSPFQLLVDGFDTERDIIVRVGRIS